MRPPADDAAHARELDRIWVEETGSRHTIRVAVRALVVRDNRILLMRLAFPGASWFFPGGGLEFDEALEGGLRRELAEEISLDVDRVAYRLVANNRFRRDGGIFHLIEHFFEVTPATKRFESLEAGVLAEWHALESIGAIDVRPHGVRNILSDPKWREVRMLESD